MHIPDGYLDPITCVVTYLIMASYGVYAYRKAEFSKNVELIVGLAAAIFIAQMFNWPIPGGTSLHLVGGALAAILLGPWNAFFVMLLVLIVQALLFHDGGITTLGANVLNMGIVAPLVGYACFRLLAAKGEKGLALGAFLGGWLSITLAGLVCGVEIGLSPSFPYGVFITVPVMTGWHALLGIVEGVITMIVVEYIRRKAPQYLRTISMGGKP